MFHSQGFSKIYQIFDKENKELKVQINKFYNVRKKLRFIIHRQIGFVLYDIFWYRIVLRVNVFLFSKQADCKCERGTIICQDSVLEH
jgi:hypothetical protein